MNTISFDGFEALNGELTKLTSDLLLSSNNYFENTDMTKGTKLKIWIDLDGKVKEEMKESDFNDMNDIIINKFKLQKNISLITSSNYKSQVWLNNRTTGYKWQYIETIPKLSYRITYINEYCEEMEHIRHFVENEKQNELKELFKDTNITIGTDSNDLINIDTNVYRRRMGKMRCVNAYKYEQQPERINKLITGTIEDTILSYIPESAKLRTFIEEPKIKQVKEIREVQKTIKTEEEKLYESKETINDNNQLKELLNGLNPIRHDNFDYWIRIYWVFINEKLNLNLFKEFSQKSNKYDEYKNESLLKQFKIVDGYKLATLYHYLKEDNHELFIKLQKKRRDFWNIMVDMNQSDLAKLYYSISSNKYVRSDKSGWYEYNNFNVLQIRNSVPSSLLNDLTNNLQQYIIEQRNLLIPTQEQYELLMKIVKKGYIQLGNATYIKGVIEYLKDLYLVENLDDLLDSNGQLLAFSNCVYDIKLKKFRMIKPDDYITITTKYKAPIKFDKNNNITYNKSINMRNEINKVFYSIFENDEMVEYYKIITGLSLFTTKLQSLFIHQGSGGNGKGILSTILRNCLGSYFLTAENTFLTSSFKAGVPNPTLANSKGVKYLYISEPDDGKDSKFNIDFIKSMTGGDPLTARGLYKDNVTFIPQFCANVQCNNKPELGKLDKGIVRRVKIIPYLLSFVDNPKEKNERQKNYNLVDEITKEDFRNEFILMLIEKAQEYYNKDYAKDIIMPSIVNKETKNYLDENNPLIDWIERRIKKTKGIREKTTTIHKAYNDDDDIDKHLNSKDMLTYMKYNGFETIKSGVLYYIDCELIPKAFEDEEHFNDLN
jgi:P4 family phage/plasmid primase-like protien